MKKRKFLLPALFIPLLFFGDRLYSPHPSASPLPGKRIVFRIATIEEDQAARKQVSLAFVEGPPGTDFDVNLDGRDFKMKAHFLTDLVGPDTLKVRSRLNTRRLYGYSERNLPLFEEDNVSQSLNVNFDEAVVLFPFGRSAGEQRLKVEIIPSWSDASTEIQPGEDQPLTIRIPDVGPKGVVSVHASKTPHRFNVQTTLLEDGNEVARGTSELLIEESQTIRIKPVTGSEPNMSDLDLELTLSNYARAPSSGEIELDFDLHHSNRPDAESTISKGVGIADLDSPLAYNLGDSLFSAGKKYQLLIKVALAEGEK